MKRLGYILLCGLALAGCQTREKTQVSKATLPDGEVSGLPKAREAKASGDVNAPPKVTKGEKEPAAPSALLFRGGSEEARAKWSAKRAKILNIHQRMLEQHEIRHENATGKVTPRVQVGEMNAHPPRVDRGD